MIAPLTPNDGPLVHGLFDALGHVQAARRKVLDCGVALTVVPLLADTEEALRREITALRVLRSGTP